jgi:hypothetical protein
LTYVAHPSKHTFEAIPAIIADDESMEHIGFGGGP